MEKNPCSVLAKPPLRCSDQSIRETSLLDGTLDVLNCREKPLTLTPKRKQHGQRSLVMIVEMSDPSKIPTLAEPWFLTFNANVEFRVVMTPDDLKKAGLDEIGKKWA
jgi:hypothetical protein